MYKIGDKVFHPIGYGNGEVISINGEFIKVKFDKFPVEIEIHKDYLKLVSTDTIKGFSIGMKVINGTFGVGKIISLSDSLAEIEFSDKIRKMSYASLKEYIDINETIEEEHVDEFNESFKIIPSNYATQSYYKTSSKEIMTYCRKKFESGIASIQSFENEDKNSKGFLLVPEKGVIVFKVFDDLNIDYFSEEIFFKVLSSNYNVENKQILDKFLNSKSLCEINDKGKILKFPLRYIYVVQNISWEKLSSSIRKKILTCNIPIYFRNFSSDNPLFDNFNDYSINFSRIDEKMYANIMERVVPENVTLIVKIRKEDKCVEIENDKNSFVPLNGKEKEFRALCLDDDQINFINNTKPGHWLTLANPGTGKSVILLSKAYRLLTYNKSFKILITCFNVNLCTHHTMFSELSGLKNDNLHLLRFYQMVFKLLDEYHIDYSSINVCYSDEEKLEKAVEILNSHIDSGRIKPLFDAIFIDEVQLFEPLWISICHKLLKNKNESYFDLYGDLNQCVRSAKLKGKASWQDKNFINLNWQGRTRYLNKNYRNSRIINEYIKNMIFEFNQTLDNYGAEVIKDVVDLKSHSVRKGKHKVLVIDISQDKLQKTVVSLVKQVHEKWKADYNEIAILFPASQLNTKYIKYFPLNWITECLSNEGIEYSLLFGKQKISLMNAGGVMLSTVDSALGLDFKYVILCGLKYWSYYWPNNSMPVKLSEESLIYKKHPNVAMDYFTEIGRKIYSACSRAKSGLIIVNDLDESSPVQRIIKPKGGKDFYVEK